MTKVRGVVTRKRAAELMLNIRREDVKRHENLPLAQNCEMIRCRHREWPRCKWS